MNENCLRDRLEEGKPTKMIIFSNNELCPILQEYAKDYPNCSLDIFRSGTSQVSMEKDYIPSDCDFIFFYSANDYEEDELNRIKAMAFKVSQEKNKRVSVGYAYAIPMDQRKHADVSEGIKIVSFKVLEEYEDSFLSFPCFDLLDLVNLTIKTHNELERKNAKTYQGD